MRLFGKKKQDQSRRPRTGSGQGYVFRRSRTLTGTTSNKVATSAESRSQLKTTRLQAHELYQLRRRLTRVLGVVLLCVGVLSYLVVNYIGDIDIAYPQRGTKPPVDTYQRSIADYFAGRPLERFGFAINRKQFTTDIEALHPELSSVDIDKNWFGGGVQFVLQFRHPVLVWETAGKRFYVDKEGVAFGYDHFGGKYVSVSDQSGVSPSEAGGAVASNRFINFLGKLVATINDSGLGNVTDIIIPAASREVDVKLQGRGYPIKTHTDRDPVEQAEDIMHALKWYDNHKVTPQYIDVRVPGKAFYR